MVHLAYARLQHGPSMPGCQHGHDCSMAATIPHTPMGYIVYNLHQVSTHLITLYYCANSGKIPPIHYIISPLPVVVNSTLVDQKTNDKTKTTSEQRAASERLHRTKPLRGILLLLRWGWFYAMGDCTRPLPEWQNTPNSTEGVVLNSYCQFSHNMIQWYCATLVREG